MLIDDTLKEVADLNYNRFDLIGHAISGKNGPYLYTDETPVRNTAHWSIIYTYLWKKTRNEKYKNISQKFLKYIQNEQRKSNNGAVECMKGVHFDHLNGLIGQAWVIEALMYAAIQLECDSYYDTAVEIFKSQTYDHKTKLWKRTELDGTVIDYDYTTNHQVWFAAAGLMIINYRMDLEIKKQIDQFMHEIANVHFDVYNDGLIKHYLNLPRPRIHSRMYYIKKMIKNCFIPLRKKDPNKYDSKAQEKGYHLFELYGYAIIANYNPSYELFTMKKFKKALTYGLNVYQYNKVLNSNEPERINSGISKINMYAYGYNSPAFEYPFVELVFSGNSTEATINSLLNLQKKLTYSEGEGVFKYNIYDYETLTARIYEYIRYCHLFNNEKL